tara:strand:+ start:1868 stop:2092 length:225 start_codon:yes stop_codon:yes gene_type:complete
MRTLLLALSASLLFTQPVYACANAMEGGGLNDQQKMLIVACLLGVMFFVGLYLSQSKARAAARGERFKDLDGEA